MIKKTFYGIVLGVLIVSTTGCAILSTALGAAVAYGISQATK